MGGQQNKNVKIYELELVNGKEDNDKNIILETTSKYEGKILNTSKFFVQVTFTYFTTERVDMYSI